MYQFMRRRLHAPVGRHDETRKKERREMKRSLVFAFMLLGLIGASSSSVQDDGVLDQVDCYADVGDPLSGTQDWQLADPNNQYCAWERQRVMLINPAYYGAHETNAANGVVAI